MPSERFVDDPYCDLCGTTLAQWRDVDGDIRNVAHAAADCATIAKLRSVVDAAVKWYEQGLKGFMLASAIERYQKGNTDATA